MKGQIRTAVGWIIPELTNIRARNRLNAKNYYDNKIKTDPEKYEKFKVKCAKASKKYYSRADYRLEQAEDQALLRFLHAEEA